MFAGFIGVTLWANLDLAVGRYALFMDELITFDGVMRILSAPTFDDLTDAVMGPEQRYGRTLFYLSALVAWPVQALGGESAVIAATRMLLPIAMGTGFLILSFGLIANGLLRLVCLVSLMVIPTTSYYATMPKPEPLQILFLALFLLMMVGRRKVVGWPWLLFGLAFGAKISVIVLLPVFMAFAFAALETRHPLWKLFLVVFNTLPWFLVGFLLSVPVVLTGEEGIASYLEWTFLNTGHGADSATVTFWSWGQLILNGWLSGSWITGVAVAAALVLPVALALFHAFAALPASSWRRPGRLLGTLAADRRIDGPFVFLCGLLLVLAIMFGVKRLWDFYLQVGMTLCIAGAFVSADRLWRGPERVRLVWVTALVMTANLVHSLPVALAAYHRLAHRTAEPAFVVQQAEYMAIEKQLRADAADANRPLRVGYDPNLFLPADDATRQIVRFWGSFKDWAVGYDVIIGYCEHIGGLPVLPNQDAITGCVPSLNAEAAPHVTVADGAACTAAPCYTPVRLDTPYILYLRRN
ncbi:hypothetical protein GBZ26_23925 [Azospirillum formosense]|uniref:Glycosyltransferase RgtA/B/C/D-like domain-containing protein n=1 Tax=Azospirillum formosense TaxID=861533 RepID=A0ABX2L3V6_9PROT|nr:hypothetical protein [Azospirillum formosense]MBY3757628.1 hypothetical protein [Azospirillum formosense]NUB22222.1 hypothetical protein [Azospirillum formosense]